jgi:hypothetical protein
MGPTVGGRPAARTGEITGQPIGGGLDSLIQRRKINADEFMAALMAATGKARR